MVVAPCSMITVNLTLTGLWWLSHQCILWDPAVCCVLEWKTWPLNLFLPAGHSQQCCPKSSGRKILSVPKLVSHSLAGCFACVIIYSHKYMYTIPVPLINVLFDVHMLYENEGENLQQIFSTWNLFPSWTERQHLHSMCLCKPPASPYLQRSQGALTC